MIKIEYKKTMAFEDFKNRFSKVCPSHITWSLTEEKECYSVLVKEPIDIHHIALSDSANVVGNPNESLFIVLDIKIFEGTLS